MIHRVVQEISGEYFGRPEYSPMVMNTQTLVLRSVLEVCLRKRKTWLSLNLLLKTPLVFLGGVQYSVLASWVKAFALASRIFAIVGLCYKCCSVFIAAGDRGKNRG